MVVDAKAEQQILALHGEAHRLERAVRFVLGAIGPLIISFGAELPLEDKTPLVQINFSYLTGIFYCIFAALAPPHLSSLAIAGCGALVGILMGVGLAVACFYVAFGCGKEWALLLLALGVFVLSSLKTGSLQGLTYLIGNISVYAAAIAFILAMPFAYEGLSMDLTTSELISRFGELTSHEDWKHLMPDWMWQASTQMFLELLQKCGNNDGSNSTLALECQKVVTVPEGPLKDMTLHMSVSGGISSLTIKPDLKMLQLVFDSSGGPLGIVVPLIKLFAIAIGFYAASLLLPLPRVRTSYNITRGELVRMITGPLQRTMRAGQAVLGDHESTKEAIDQAQVATKGITDRVTPLLATAKTSAFEPGWPGMGLPLLPLMPRLVLAVRDCARSATALVARASEHEADLMKQALQTSGDTAQAAANLLAAMPHSGDDLTGVPGGARSMLEKSRDELQRLSEKMPENECGWTFRHGVIHHALTLADDTIRLCDLRASSTATFGGAAKSSAMMLGGFLLPGLVPFYRMVQPLLTCIKGRARGGGCDGYDLRIQIGLTVGVVLLVLPSMYSEAWANFGVNLDIARQVGLRGNFSFWAVLGFIVSYTPTLEGAVHRSGLRAMGTVAGAFAGWLSVTCFGAENIVALIIWLLVSYALAVGLGANSQNKLLGFSLSWGYAAQLFTYTQTIIVVEASLGIGTIDSLTISRLLAQLLGIIVALLMSVLLWVRAGAAAKQRVAHGLELCARAIKELPKGSKAGRAGPQELLQAAEELLEHAQAALDDAKVEFMPKQSHRILGPGGVGMDEARAILADCRSILCLAETGRRLPLGSLAATETTLSQAAERLRSASVDPVFDAPREVEEDSSEVAWLCLRIDNAARQAGVGTDDTAREYGQLCPQDVASSSDGDSSDSISTECEDTGRRVLV